MSALALSRLILDVLSPYNCPSIRMSWINAGDQGHVNWMLMLGRAARDGDNDCKLSHNYTMAITLLYGDAMRQRQICFYLSLGANVETFHPPLSKVLWEVATMLVVDALMRREGLPFNASDLLHEYCVVRPRRDVQTPCILATTISDSRNPISPRRGWLPALHIREWVVWRLTTSSEELSEEISENARIVQALDLAKHESTPSTSSPAPDPIPIIGVLVVSPNSEAAEDLDFAFILPMAEDEIEHSFTPNGADLNSTLEMSPKPKDIGPKKGKEDTPKTV
ncbi:hypothetical protein Acr_00g0100160 [Actinidia rufa]|uniref:Uncharacterized protein n=1 Tax=Actinidia rufa TaxID=165716 RepID=A0A7J0DZT8_9ERIC|nr:hypothetical protein Acr_00g0100160 [Actinidia rufa]